MLDFIRAELADVPDHLLRLAVAWLLALPIAWDREKNERSAGLRTFPLVAIATCGFIIATEKMMAGSGDAHSRMLQGVIMGIGFIGSGAILKMHGMVHGTATAASIWVVGAVGIAAAYRQYDVALALSLAVFLTLRFMRPFKSDRADEMDGINPRDDR